MEASHFGLMACGHFARAAGAWPSAPPSRRRPLLRFDLLWTSKCARGSRNGKQSRAEFRRAVQKSRRRCRLAADRQAHDLVNKLSRPTDLNKMTSRLTVVREQRLRLNPTESSAQRRRKIKSMQRAEFVARQTGRRHTGQVDSLGAPNELRFAAR